MLHRKRENFKEQAGSQGLLKLPVENQSLNTDMQYLAGADSKPRGRQTVYFWSDIVREKWR